MQEPIISWHEYVDENDPIEGINTLNSWNAGTIQADAVNPPRKNFIIWNNKGGSETVKTIEDPMVGTRDSTGGFDQPFVRERWVKGKFPSKTSWDAETESGTPDFNIGAGEGSDGQWDDEGYKMPIEAVGAVPTNTIEGNSNNGELDETGGDRNYAIFELMISVPYEASAGAVSGRIRLDYIIS